MKFPNKLYSYEESVLYDSTILMSKLDDEMSVFDLYMACKSKVNGIQEFYDALAVLYAIKKIDYSYETGRVYRVI